MSILVNKDTKVIVQGLTGKEGTFHAQQCLDYGTKILAGVTPFKGGTKHLNIPIFNTVKEAVAFSQADVSLVFVPAVYVADAIIEAANAGIKLCIVITEGAPVKDIQKAKVYANRKNMSLIGPNSPGIITSNECKLGIMPANIFKKGNIAVISKSGTLTYEAAYQIGEAGFGVSTAVGIGGDPIVGLSFKDLLKLFEEDKDTEAIVLIGEIGGDLEIQAAKYIKKNIKKPIVAFIAGITAPKGKRMGHAGAIISGSSGSAQEKIDELRKAGVHVVSSPSHIGSELKKVMSKI